MNKPKVLLVGCGYAGVNLIKALGSSADITVIEKREAFFHYIAVLRSLVNRDWLPQLFVSYKALLGSSRWIRSEVVSVDANEVILSDGQHLNFDYVVLATGVSYAFPAHAKSDSVEDTKQHYAQLFEQVQRAKGILIAGGGAVGVEIAGEISSVYTDKSITVVHSGANLIGAPFNLELGRRLYQQLEQRGVKIILNDTVNLEPSATGVYTTKNGARVEADLVFKAFGGRPNTDYLRATLPDALDAAGRVKVNSHLQLEGHTNIFALGDITNIDEVKTAINGSKHAEIIAHNIKALQKSSTLKAYKPSKVPTAVVPLGPTGGAGHLPFGAGFVVNFLARVKGRTLFVERFRGMTYQSNPNDSV